MKKLKINFVLTLISISIGTTARGDEISVATSPGIDCYNNDYCNWKGNLINDIGRDFTTYFQPCNLLAFSGSLVAAGIFANTGLDRSIANYWQRDVRSRFSNHFFKTFNRIGGLRYCYFGIYLGSMAVGVLKDCSPIGNALYTWGYRSLRTLGLAFVQQVPLTYILGSGRPCSHKPSKWQPFRYRTGVSGHAIWGAIPFLTAAMMTDQPLARYGLYLLSTLPGLARINNNSHYFSQVLLGWSIAYLSARSVYWSDQACLGGVQLSVVPSFDGAMMLAQFEF